MNLPRVLIPHPSYFGFLQGLSSVEENERTCFLVSISSIWRFLVAIECKEKEKKITKKKHPRAFRKLNLQNSNNNYNNESLNL